MGSVKVDVPHAGAWEEFDKDTKSAKITAVARYRYMIAVEGRFPLGRYGLRRGGPEFPDPDHRQGAEADVGQPPA